MENSISITIKYSCKSVDNGSKLVYNNDQRNSSVCQVLAMEVLSVVIAQLLLNRFLTEKQKHNLIINAFFFKRAFLHITRFLM